VTLEFQAMCIVKKMNFSPVSVLFELLIKQTTDCSSVVCSKQQKFNLSSDTVASASFSDARTIRAFIHRSHKVERRRFFMIRDLLIARSAGNGQGTNYKECCTVSEGGGGLTAAGNMPSEM